MISEKVSIKNPSTLEQGNRKDELMASPELTGLYSDMLKITKVKNVVLKKKLQSTTLQNGGSLEDGN